MSSLCDVMKRMNGFGCRGWQLTLAKHQELH
jgi:hypothetical protein